jgi:hypothetical protein
MTPNEEDFIENLQEMNRTMTIQDKMTVWKKVVLTIQQIQQKIKNSSFR